MPYHAVTQSFFSTPKATPKRQGLDYSTLNTGDIVRHVTFGEGEILKITQTGDDAILTIDFNGTVKRYMASQSTLSKGLKAIGEVMSNVGSSLFVEYKRLLAERTEHTGNATDPVDLRQYGTQDELSTSGAALLDVLPRVRKEALENLQLSPYASRAAQSRGRVLPEPECPVRTVFERDVGRILYSLPFRRLRHKTQVFFNPQNDHICTRMEHVLYVSYLAERSEAALALTRR